MRRHRCNHEIFENDGNPRSCAKLQSQVDGDWFGRGGKTSLIRALQSSDDRCSQIDADDRTVGIDLALWKTGGNKTEFQIWDFAGQRVYYLAHQLFLSDRALYLLVWRVLRSVVDFDAQAWCSVCEKELGEQSVVYQVGGKGLCHDYCVSYNELVCEWLDKLQSRVPGAVVGLVATHCDGAIDDDVHRQCEAVRRAVEDFVSKNGKNGLAILQGGHSFQVSSTSGMGIAELRSQIIKNAMNLPFYGTYIPQSYLNMQDKILKMKQDRHWLHRSEIEEIVTANIGNNNATTELDIRFAMSYLEESGVILKIDSSLNRDRIFIDLNWIIGLVKVLVCHDHIRLAKKEIMTINLDDRDKMIEALNALTRSAVLDPLLLKLPCMWGTLEPNVEDHGALLQLLHSCDILMKSSTDGWVVPCLLGNSRTRTLDARAFDGVVIKHRRRIYYQCVPIGYFFRFVVRLGECTSNSTFNSTICAVHHRGQTGFVRMVAMEDNSTSFIEMASSGSRLVDTMMQCVDGLEEFFPGLKRLQVLVECCNCRDVMKIKNKGCGWIDYNDGEHCCSVCDCKDVEMMPASSAGVVVFCRLSNDDDKLELDAVINAAKNADVDVVLNDMNAADEAAAVIVCMTKHTRDDNDMDDWSRKAITKMLQQLSTNRAIIPVLMSSYGQPTFPKWAPSDLDVLNSLIVVMSSEDGCKQITNQVVKQLEEWAPASISKQNTEETTSSINEETTTLPCPECKKKGTSDPYMFSKTACILSHNCRNETIQCFHATNPCGQVKLSSVLNTRIINAAIPCPSCGGNFVFSRDECFEARAAGKKTLVCGNEQTSIALSQLIPAEIFISYNWGPRTSDGKFETQEIVKAVKDKIENEHGLICWLDLGQMGAGTDLDIAMREGVRECSVVLMFLDERYSQSANCLKELNFATSQFSKYIVPLILDKKAFPIQEEDGGWKWGTPSNDFICSKFSAIMNSTFAPIDFSEPEKRDKALKQAMERIQSRFHRDARSCEPRPAAMVANMSQLKSGMLEWKRRTIASVIVWKQVRAVLNHDKISLIDNEIGKVVMAVHMRDIVNIQGTSVKKHEHCIEIERSVETVLGTQGKMCIGSIGDTSVYLKCRSKEEAEEWLEMMLEAWGQFQQQKRRLGGMMNNK